MKLLSALSFVVAGALAVLPRAGVAGSEGARAQPHFSARLIVKFKAGADGSSLSQVQAESRGPLPAKKLKEMSVTVGQPLEYVRTLPTGGHVVVLSGATTPQSIRAAIEALRTRPDVEYVEEDMRRLRREPL